MLAAAGDAGAAGAVLVFEEQLVIARRHRKSAKTPRLVVRMEEMTFDRPRLLQEDESGFWLGC